MDPLSIASTVVALTATCLSTCKKLSDLAGSYEDVPVVVAMLCSESTVISCALSQMQILILQRDDLAQAWASKTDVLDAFEMSLNGCMIVFSCLEAETRQLQSQNTTTQKFWTKIKFMWNQDRLKELLTALRGQQMSINFLLQVLECKTLSDIQRDVQSNKARIRASMSDAQSVRSGNPSVRIACESVFDNDTHRLSMFADDLVSVVAAPSELEFEFDNFVLNSQAYRRVFAKAQGQISQQVQVQNITEDLIDLSNDTHEDTEITTIRDIHEDLADLDLSQRRSSISSMQKTPPQTPPSITRKPVPALDPIPSAPSLRSSTPASDYQKDRRLCFKCGEVLTGQFVRAIGHCWHMSCFTCADCQQLVAHKFFPVDEGDVRFPVCETDYFRRLDLLCEVCGGALRGSYITASGKKYHVDHFRCGDCDVVFNGDDAYYEHEGGNYCFTHYCGKYARSCQGCSWPILRQFVEIDGNEALHGFWHAECYLLRKHLGITLTPTRKTQRFLKAIEQLDSGNDKGVIEYNEQFEAMTKTLWESTSVCLEALTKEARLAQRACAKGTADTAFRRWNAFTALFQILLQAAEKGMAAQSTKLPPINADSSIAGLQAEDMPPTNMADLIQPRSLRTLDEAKHFPEAMLAATRAILITVLQRLLQDDEWPQAGSRLSDFLSHISVAGSMNPLPAFAKSEPTESDFACLLCPGCSTMVRTEGYHLDSVHAEVPYESGGPKWHPECLLCPHCGRKLGQQNFAAGTSTQGVFCNDCGGQVRLRRLVKSELLAEALWASWLVRVKPPLLSPASPPAVSDSMGRLALLKAKVKRTSQTFS